MPRFLHAVRDSRPRLVVAGGGVGGLEAVLALRSLAGDLPTVELVCPEREFVYRAMSVAEPFGFAAAPALDLERLERRLNIRHHSDTLVEVEPERKIARLGSGEEIPYKALISALGAQPRAWLEGALNFTGPAAVEEMRDLLAGLESGEVDGVVFTAPPGSAWMLPAYELALLTSTWSAGRGLAAPALHVVTPEPEPFAAFGPTAGRTIRDLLRDRGIRLHLHAHVTSFDGRRARLAHGEEIAAGAVVALPQLTGRPLPGLPADEDGFIPVDDHCRVVGTRDVYAVGDGAAHAVKQGGLAAQQADTAAATIARDLGLPVEVTPYRPVMRAMLLTGLAPVFMRDGEMPEPGSAGFKALWWPPTKVAGRHLAAYIAGLESLVEPPPLVDRAPAEHAERSARQRDEIRALALEMAAADASWGDYRSAARWLQTVEWMDGALSEELSRRRDEWIALA